jgi:hypothetical protein
MCSIGRISNPFYVVKLHRWDYHDYAFLRHFAFVCLSDISRVFELAFVVFHVCPRNHRVYLSSNQNHMEIDSKLIVLDRRSRNQCREIFDVRNFIHNKLPLHLVLFPLPLCDIHQNLKRKRSQLGERLTKQILLYGIEFEHGDVSLLIDFSIWWESIFARKQAK